MSITIANGNSERSIFGPRPSDGYTPHQRMHHACFDHTAGNDDRLKRRIININRAQISAWPLNSIRPEGFLRGLAVKDSERLRVSHFASALVLSDLTSHLGTASSALPSVTSHKTLVILWELDILSCHRRRGSTGMQVKCEHALPSIIDANKVSHISFGVHCISRTDGLSGDDKGAPTLYFTSYQSCRNACTT